MLNVHLLKEKMSIKDKKNFAGISIYDGQKYLKLIQNCLFVF